MNKSFLLIGAAVVSIGLPASASAQNADKEGASDQSTGVVDIIVTAERRETSVQKTPIALSAIGGEELRQRQLNSVGDALQQTPGVVIPNSSKGQAVFIRGIGSTGDAQEGGDPAVNLNIDGIYQQQAIVPLASSFDINRIEVLRGPQGTLYGRNSNAGSVNIVTNEPILGANEGYANLQLGNYNAIRAEAAGNVSLTDTTAMRLAFTTNRHDGYYSNGGSSADGYAGRVKLRYQPTSDLKIVLTGLYARETGNPSSTVPAPLNKSDPYNTTYPAYDGTNGNPYFPPLADGPTEMPHGIQDVTFAQLYGQLDYSFNFATLTVLAGWNYTHQYQDTALLPFGALAQDVSENAYSLETRLTSAKSSPVRWVIGGYYYSASDTPALDAKVTLDFPHNPRSYPVNVASKYGSRTFAVFGQATVPITDSFRLTGGARYTHDVKSREFQLSTAPLVYEDGPRYRGGADSGTFKGGLELDLGASSMLYGQISNGYKAGGFNTNGTYYKPEKITAYEAGVKNRFFGNLVQLNVGGFYYDYVGYQASIQAPDASDTATGSSAQTINAASLQTYGSEAELTIQPTHSDRFYANVAYLHSRGHFVYTGGSYTTPVSVDIDNVTPPNSPTWSGSIGYSHRFEFANGASITPRVDSRISGGYDTSIDVSDYDYQKKFTRTDASITFSNPSESISIRAFIRNIENNVQKAFTLAPPVPFAALELTDPQTYGISLSAKF